MLASARVESQEGLKPHSDVDVAWLYVPFVVESQEGLKHRGAAATAGAVRHPAGRILRRVETEKRELA